MSRPSSPTPSQLPPMPESPVYSLASTALPLSQYNLPLPPPPRPLHAVITNADLERSQEAYAELLTSAKAYRVALAALSTAASTFGSALEACARLKEARSEPIGPAGAANMTASFTTKGQCTADTLMSASGVHHLIANHQQILSETVYRSFEVPLLHELDKWQTVIGDEEETYQHNIKAQSREVKRLEKEGLKLHKQRRRDVARFRAHLVELTYKLDGLTSLHADHARTLLRESQETSGRIVEASCSLVRAEVDIFESLARKGWSGGGLDDVLEKGQDLFAIEDDGIHGAGASGGEGVKLFSILPPKSILADSASEPRSESLLTDGDRYQSLAAMASDPKPGGDSESVFSADFNKPRNARPFSPQPIRRAPTDVTFDLLDNLVGPSSLSLQDGLFPPIMDAGIKEEDEGGDGDEGEDRHMHQGEEPYQQEPYQQEPYQQEPYQQEPYQQEPYQGGPYQQEPYQGGSYRGARDQTLSDDDSGEQTEREIEHEEEEEEGHQEDQGERGRLLRFDSHFDDRDSLDPRNDLELSPEATLRNNV
ncbi:phospholipid-binding [Trichoderma cornu-damae]|uniref:Phospholipid-binding n=1 Tax=Trichoderma cornu-damae TaxID=654480 RepID=A0A9P8QFZ6_9HYPO|nr:phospholipid-binding [Trichoderma cornu-damae]